MPRRAGLGMTMAIAALAAATPVPARAQDVAEVEVAPRTVTVAVGQRVEVLASAFDAGGDIVTVPFRWVSSNPEVARVEADPNVAGVASITGVTAGIASVEARVGRRARSVAVQVIAGGQPVAAGMPPGSVLRIEPAAIHLFPTEDIRLTPVFLADDGSPAAPAPLSWQSLRTDVATVTPDGVAVGVSPGQGVIQATTPSGLVSRVTVQVGQAAWAFAEPVLALSPGHSDTLSVIVPEQNRRPVNLRWLSWRSSDPSVVSVTPLGVAIAEGAGRAQIVASGFGQDRAALVSVHRPIAALSVQPAGVDTVLVPLGGAVPFAAAAVAADDSRVPEAPVVWSVADSTVARFDPNTKVVVGRGIGQTRLEVRVPGSTIVKTWTLRVAPAGLVLQPDRLGVALRGRPTLRASYTDSVGKPVAEARDVTWSVADPRILRVEGTGVLLPLSYGVTDVVATSASGRRDTARVYVQGEILITSTRAGSPDIFAFDRDRAAQLHRVTDHPERELAAVYSPDGSRIAFVSDRDGNAALYVANADGTEPHRVTSHSAASGAPDWTPGGDRLVYESATAGTSHIWVIGVDGTGPRQLTEGSRPDFQPAVSPDGSAIAFTSTRDGNYEIYVMTIDGANPRNVTSTPHNETMPAWIGDGVLAFVREERGARDLSRVVVRMPIGGEAEALTSPELAVTDFAVSRAGDLLVVVAPEQGGGGLRPRLFLVPVGGGAPTEVPRADDHDQFATPSIRP